MYKGSNYFILFYSILLYSVLRGLWDLSSVTMDWTQALNSESAES